MTEHKEACCTSPAAVCYWFAVSLVAWGVLSLIGIYWRPLHAPSAAACLFAIAIGCAANWLRNRTFHCAIIFDRCSGIPGVRPHWDSPQQSLGLAIRCYRSWHRVSTGMAVYEAFCVVALRLRLSAAVDATRSRRRDTSTHEYGND